MKKGSTEEKALLAALRRGDSEAFTTLVDAFGGKIHALARRYARSEADAEDLTQETLIEVCRSLPTFRGEAALSTFIYRIAMNRCLKYRERQARANADNVSLDDLPIAADLRDGPEHRAERNELARTVNHALQSLSEGHRDVVLLHEMHGMTYAECAQILNVPVGTVKSRLFHAFARLRERLGGYVRGEERPLSIEEKEITSRQVVAHGRTGGAR